MNKNEPVNIIKLTALQIKGRLEQVLGYDHTRFAGLKIPFEKKFNIYSKLPFSDYKIAIAKELNEYEALQENINKLKTFKYQEMIFKKQEEEYNNYLKKVSLLENHKHQEVIYEVVEEKVVTPENLETSKAIDNDDLVEIEEPKIESITPASVTKKKKEKKIVDTNAIVAKIISDGHLKNKGKKVIGRKEINKMLDPFGIKNRLKKDLGVVFDDKEVMTSIDIYLSAVDKISTNDNNQNSYSNKKKMTIEEILKDL